MADQPLSRYALWRRNNNSRSVTDQYPYNSIGYKTFINVVDTICCIAYKHSFIQQVDFGDLWEVDLTKNDLWPYFYLQPKGVATDDSNIKYSFQMIIMDLVEPDGSNELQVMSDTLQILQDIISLLRNGVITKTDPDGRPVYYIDSQFTLSPFTERFDNSVSGWVTDLELIVDNPYPACNVPLDDDSNCVD